MAVNNHGSRITHQADVDTRGVQMHRRRVVVGRHHGYGLAPLVLLAEVGQRDALVGVLRLRAAVDGVFRDITKQPQKGLRRTVVFGYGRAAEGLTK